MSPEDLADRAHCSRWVFDRRWCRRSVRGMVTYNLKNTLMKKWRTKSEFVFIYLFLITHICIQDQCC